MSELTEEIRLVERIECAKEVRTEGDSYRAAAEQAKDAGRIDDATKLFAQAEALYKVAGVLARRSMA
jgi:hypothetical protein